MPIQDYRSLLPRNARGPRSSPLSGRFLGAAPAPSRADEEIANIFGRAAGDVGDAMAYDPASDPRYYGARKNQAETEDILRARQGREEIANVFTDPALPADQKLSRAQALGMRYGIEPDDVTSAFFSSMALTGTNDQLMRMNSAVRGGSGPDQAFTEGRQDYIRSDNERIGDERQTMQDDAAMARLFVEEQGRDKRTGMQIDAEDARAATRNEQDLQGVPLTQQADLEEELDAQLGIVFNMAGEQVGGPAIEPKVRTAVRARAIDNYLSQPPGRQNVVAAVQQALSELTETTPGWDPVSIFGNNIPYTGKLAHVYLRPEPEPAADAFVQGSIPNLTGGASADLFAPPSAGGSSAASTEPPPPPRNPADREVGRVYTLPKGRFKWTAEGWIPA